MPDLRVAVLVPDGAADLPLEQLGGRTPLQAAETPNMDRIAAAGAVGLARTIPSGMQPGSDVANLSLLGYDPAAAYAGRGPIEAASMGVEIPRGWTAFRCNLVRTDGERMIDYSAGHISADEGGRLIEALESRLGDARTRFYHGVSYRNLLLLQGDFTAVRCTPPHDITGEPLEPYLPTGEGAGRVLELIEASRDVLAAFSPAPSADLIWPWGQGTRMELEPFRERFGLEGAVISAVDLVRGLAVLAGLQAVQVPGMTGFLDTDYAAKGRAAVELLGRLDFVYVHVEAPDEASHMGDVGEKLLALERFDRHVAGPVLEHLERAGAGWRVLVAPDHPTFIGTRTHDGSPVPYAACGSGITPSGSNRFDEEAAAAGGPDFDPGWKLMRALTAEEWAAAGSGGPDAARGGQEVE